MPSQSPLRALAILALLALLAGGCATLIRSPFDEAFGLPDPTRFDHPGTAPAGAPSFRKEVLPVLESRCVVCHACYDAPCQLKLGSWEGITRGASKALVYDGTRLKEATPSRLYVDADQASDWRQRGFHSVLNERRPSAEANLELSPLYRTLAQKAAHPLPETPVLDDAFDFSLNRAQQCPSAEEFSGFEKRQPLAGMPYGLPGLSPDELGVIKHWIAAGAHDDEAPPLSDATRQRIQRWEAFLNAPALKTQLMARYLFEHLFLGHLYFPDDVDQRWFRLIRSSTPSGQPARPIATRQPFDAPGPGPMYYRLVEEKESIVAKTHMPYRLDDARMKRWQTLFLAPEIQLAQLPPYSANPFETYQAIPVANRFQFLLDDAAYFVDGFIKGPVCRGQIALNVINDRFWVFFADPSTHTADTDAFIAREAGELRLPTEEVSPIPLISWQKYRRLEARYLDAQALYLKDKFARQRPDQRIVWDGERHNPNAALTVLRHFDSASVVQGLVGTPPKTAWLLTYPLLERIHYLLVAGFDVYGNVGHQLNARLYMDFLRMEGETNILMLLPKAARLDTLNQWYRNDSADVREKFFENEARQSIETGIAYRSKEPLKELYSLLRDRVAPALKTRHDLTQLTDPDLRKALQPLENQRGRALSLLPETIFVRIERTNGTPVDVTLFRNSSHSTISHLFTEALARRPEEDTLTIMPGFVGAYPNAFYRLRQEEIPQLAETIARLKTERDYSQLAQRFAIRRTRADFWAHLDQIHQTAKAATPVEFGLFDLNRLENR